MNFQKEQFLIIFKVFGKKNKIPLVNISDFRESEVTKKCDIETGEDNKGE